MAVERLTPQEYFEKKKKKLRENRERRVVNIPGRRGLGGQRLSGRKRLLQGDIGRNMVVLGIIGVVAIVAIAGVVIAVRA